MKIRFVTDSSSDLDWSIAEELNVSIVSLTVTFDDKTVLKENENFDLYWYYKKYQTEDDFYAKTSQPLPKDYYETYMQLIEEGAEEIIVICVSSGLSGTINSARLGANMVKRENKKIKIHTVDSLNASYAEVFLLEEGLRLAKEGFSGEEISERLRNHVRKISTFLLLPSLKYLHKGGRISTTKYVLGRMLKKKPIVYVNKQGKNEVVTTVTSIDEGMNELLKLATKEYQKLPKRITIVHANNLEKAEIMEQKIKEKIENMGTKIICTGVTISAHTGPDVIALISEFR